MEGAVALAMAPLGVLDLDAEQTKQRKYNVFPLPKSYEGTSRVCFVCNEKAKKQFDIKNFNNFYFNFFTKSQFLSLFMICAKGNSPFY